MAPHHWPSNVQYICQSRLAKDFPHDVLEQMTQPRGASTHGNNHQAASSRRDVASASRMNIPDNRDTLRVSTIRRNDKTTSSAKNNNIKPKTQSQPRDTIDAATSSAQSIHHQPTWSGTVFIQPITDPSHPAYNQKGLFASRKIKPHSFICEYAGEIHVDERVGSNYDLSLFKAVKRSRVSEVAGDEWGSTGVRTGNGGNGGDDVAGETGVALSSSETATQNRFWGNGSSDSQDGESALAPTSLARTGKLTHSKLSSFGLLLNVSADASVLLESTIEYINVGIDAEKMGNEARFINDYRGVPISLSSSTTSAKKIQTISTRLGPNAFFEEVWIEGMLCMGVWSGKEGIRKGEEIIVSYGKGWWRARE
ncbi:uncharacterized protein EI90DRAFT_3050725 [Cantharellus anzutake]|uniref:uncharacterized protein n=1 Tax=Cantharellus anzutake TaxID=1750568 RepID=UPI001907595F|nr:uncharacterized protein EI90DRAFT_3050725 [Cantharellus anzutake]KAF8334023.1 hypothetical protein EI90DRAFT_3050725 [Cantharellus anzutake]